MGDRCKFAAKCTDENIPCNKFTLLQNKQLNNPRIMKIIRTKSGKLGNRTAQWRSRPKILGEGKKFGEAKMLDFRRTTVFLFWTPLLKAQNDYIC